MMSRRIRELRQADDGATVVEFAILSPVLLVLLMGLFDMTYNLYCASVLQGAIQDAARDSAIEEATPDQLDAHVTGAVHNVVPTAQVTFQRKAYSDYWGVGMAEDFSDLNGSGDCDDGEPFEDINGNGTWDRDRGNAGVGGASDVVRYTVTAEYPRAFPIANFIGLSNTFSVTAETVLRNQPFDAQSVQVTTENCS